MTIEDVQDRLRAFGYNEVGATDGKFGPRKGNSMSGVVYFGKSPFRLRNPGPTTISVPYVPQTLDGGGPDTDYTGLPVVDCGGVTQDPTVRTIDGRVQGEAP